MQWQKWKTRLSDFYLLFMLSQASGYGGIMGGIYTHESFNAVEEAKREYEEKKRGND